MTREEAIEMLKAKLECITNETSGTNPDCNASLCDNCDLNYAMGNMGQHKEYIKMAIEALEDIFEMSVAIDTITYTEGYTYGFDNELKKALKWIERSKEE